MDAPLPSPATVAAPSAPAASATIEMVTASVPVPPLPLPSLPPLAFSTPPAQPSFESAWPRSAQTAFICLLVLAAILLGLQAVRSTSWGSRPTSLEPGSGLGYRIDLNRADLAELMQMPGIGGQRARKIIAYRETSGGFRTASDLLQVPGFGPATFERLEPWICVATEEEADADEPPPGQVVKLVRPIDNRAAPEKRRAPQDPNKKAAKLTAKIDLNRASPEELQRLPRVGAVTARRIVEERAKRPFQSVDDLLRVRGIKAKTLAILRPHVTVGEKEVRVARAE